MRRGAYLPDLLQVDAFATEFLRNLQSFEPAAALGFSRTASSHSRWICIRGAGQRAFKALLSVASADPKSHGNSNAQARVA
jgi:hypothetical protein